MQIAPLPDTTGYLRINELKNHAYCPRIPYYTLCMGMDRTTRLAEMGVEAEIETKHRMNRRKHALHSVVEGTRHSDVAVWSRTWQLMGNVDEIVETSGGLYLVDYKDTAQDYGYWQMQMQAYRLCVEECLSAPVLGCYIYTIPDMAYHPVALDRRVLGRLDRAIQAMQDVLKSEVCPPPTPHQGKCRVCQYRCFCNDVR